jgi:hypothetical protein
MLLSSRRAKPSTHRLHANNTGQTVFNFDGPADRPVPALSVAEFNVR